MAVLIETPCPRYEEIGINVNGEYRQLNANILQIENEYYSSVRPKQVPDENEKPALALQRRGVRYVELRSLDINIFDPQGISETQCRFLETLMAFCLMQDSPVISPQERKEIDDNLNAVCYRGREPGLLLQRRGKTVSLRQWAGELCETMTGFAKTLDENEPDNSYQQALQQQVEAVKDPDRTFSAQVLEEMRKHNEGYFHYSQRMSRQHQQYFLDMAHSRDQFQAFNAAVTQSIADQKSVEDSDTISFEEFLENYFAQTL